MLCPTLILASSSLSNLKYCWLVRWICDRWYCWSWMMVYNQASKVWNSSWMGIVMQHGGCVLACLPHSNLVTCNAGGLRCLKGHAEDEKLSFESCAHVNWTKTHSAADTQHCSIYSDGSTFWLMLLYWFTLFLTFIT